MNRLFLGATTAALLLSGSQGFQLKRSPSSSPTTTKLPTPLVIPRKSLDISLYVSITPDDNDNHGQNTALLPPLLLQGPPAHFRSFSDDLIPVLIDHEHALEATTPQIGIVEQVLSTYMGPRIVLAVIAAVYGTNFPLGHIMNENMPASAATCARMVLAALALSPFLPRIQPDLRLPAIACGVCTATGYVAQSIALVDTDPSKVSFLGAATVLWCPFLEWAIDKRPMGVKDAPQTWLAAVLCLAGVAALELYQPGGSTADVALSLQKGDFLALLQAVGFGTGCFLSARMVQKEPSQVLPITSVIIFTTAFLAMIWCFMDGWMTQPNHEVYTLPAMFLDESFRNVALAVLWTGIISTSLNFVIEISALGRVPPSEASVLLASEPLWAALFAATIFHQSTFGMNDYIGGACIVAACLVNAVLKPSDFHALLGSDKEKKNNNPEENIQI